MPGLGSNPDIVYIQVGVRDVRDLDDDGHPRPSPPSMGAYD